MITGAYGQDWVTGVLAEHVPADVSVYVSSNGKTFVMETKGSRVALPVLCGEIVEIYTEDGTIHGRCGQPVYERGIACPGHQEMIEAWRNEPQDAWYEDESF